MLAAVMDSLKVSVAPLENRLRIVHERALDAAFGFRQAEAALLEALICVERERVFVKLGFSSMFTYAVEALGLSESVAYSAIAVARKACEVPALQAVISRGELSIAKAKKIVSVLNAENQEEWIEKARRVIAKKGIQSPSVPVETLVTVTSSDNVTVLKRTSIPAPIEHQVHLRDQHLCQFPRPDGSICGGRRWVDIHHIQEVSQGGRHEIQNLITLCKAHHREVHASGSS